MKKLTILVTLLVTDSSWNSATESINNQVVGRNIIGSRPSKIVEYLNLGNSFLYTGHALRKNSATLLANKGIEVLGLKSHGGWRSSTVAKSSVGDSLKSKIEFVEKILHGETYNNVREVSYCLTKYFITSCDTLYFKFLLFK